MPHKPGKWGNSWNSPPHPFLQGPDTSSWPSQPWEAACLYLCLPITPSWYLPPFLIMITMSCLYLGGGEMVGGGRGRKKSKFPGIVLLLLLPLLGAKLFALLLLPRLARSLGSCPSLFPFLPVSLSSCLPPPSKEKHPHENCRVITHSFLREQLSLCASARRNHHHFLLLQIHIGWRGRVGGGLGSRWR